MNEKMLKTGGCGGFFLIPRDFFRMIIRQKSLIVTDELAYVILLFVTRFTASEQMERGESDLSLEQWSQLFRWTKWRTRCFLNTLLDDGVLTERYIGRKRILRAVYYEEVCGKSVACAPPVYTEWPEGALNHTEESFERFWKHYHEVNYCLKPSHKDLALKAWRKLSLEDRQMAYENVQRYWFTMTNIHHSRRAYNYLRFRCFDFS